MLSIIPFNFFPLPILLILISCNSDRGMEKSADKAQNVPNSTEIVNETIKADTISNNTDTDSIQLLIKKVNESIPYIEGPMLNDSLWKLKQQQILQQEDSLAYYLKRLFSIPNLKIGQLTNLQLGPISNDLKLLVLSVDENTGGTFRSSTVYTFYRNKGSFKRIKNESQLNVNSLYTLGNNRYILIAGAPTCSTCEARSIVELKINGSNLDTLYSFTESARMGMINDFTYDPKARTFTYDSYGYCIDGNVNEDGSLNEHEMEKCRVKGNHVFK